MLRSVVVIAALAMSGSAVAQTAPRPPYAVGGSAMDRHRLQADQHRYEMDRLRLQADQREQFARQLQAETRLNRLEVEIRRQPEVLPRTEPRLLRSPAEERASREAAAERRRQTAGDVGQIDAWLDRRPN